MERRPLAEKNAVTHALTRALKAACEGYWRAAVLLYPEDITLLKATCEGYWRAAVLLYSEERGDTRVDSRCC